MPLYRSSADKEQAYFAETYLAAQTEVLVAEIYIATGNMPDEAR